MKRKWIVLMLAGGILAFLVVLGLGVGGYLYWRHRQRAERSPVEVDVIAAFAGASAEEVERQVTIPLEVNFAGMPGLKSVRSKSVFGLAKVRLVFESDTDFRAARQEVINRLQFLQMLPHGVTPQLVPVGPVVVCYTLSNPQDASGKAIYSPTDLKALQDGKLERQFRTLPRVADVISFGGTIKRYEVRPDPDRLRRYGITLRQLETALAAANANVAGHLPEGKGGLAIRGVGLLGGGLDPFQTKEVTGAKHPGDAAAFLRADETRRLQEIRKLVIATINMVPVRIDDLVEGGPLSPLQAESGQRGVVVSHQAPRGTVGLSRRRRDTTGLPALNQDGQSLWTAEPDCVEGLVVLHQGEDASHALLDVQAKIKELNETPGALLPGVRIDVHYPQQSIGKPPEPVAAIWLQGSFPANVSLDGMSASVRTSRDILQHASEIESILWEIGRPEDGTHLQGPNEVQFWLSLRPEAELPAPPDRSQPRTRTEFAADLTAQLRLKLPGSHWSWSPAPQDDFCEAFVPSPGEHLLKIRGPDLDELDRLADQAQKVLEGTPGIEDLGVLPHRGQLHFDFHVDLDKCAHWGVPMADVQDVLRLALDGKAASGIVEGEKIFDLTLHWPKALCGNEMAILQLPVDFTPPAPPEPAAATPRLRLQDLVSPLDAQGKLKDEEAFLRQGPTAICREDGYRLIAIKFRVMANDIGAVEHAQARVARLLRSPYRAEWSKAP